MPLRASTISFTSSYDVDINNRSEAQNEQRK